MADSLWLLCNDLPHCSQQPCAMSVKREHTKWKCTGVHMCACTCEDVGAHTGKHAVIHHSVALLHLALSCTPDLTHFSNWTGLYTLTFAGQFPLLIFFPPKIQNPKKSKIYFSKKACQARIRGTWRRYIDCFCQIKKWECSVGAKANQYTCEANGLHQDRAMPKCNR